MLFHFSRDGDRERLDHLPRGLRIEVGRDGPPFQRRAFHAHVQVVPASDGAGDLRERRLHEREPALRPADEPQRDVIDADRAVGRTDACSFTSAHDGARCSTRRRVASRAANRDRTFRDDDHDTGLVVVRAHVESRADVFGHRPLREHPERKRRVVHYIEERLSLDRHHPLPRPELRGDAQPALRREHDAGAVAEQNLRGLRRAGGMLMRSDGWLRRSRRPRARNEQRPAADENSEHGRPTSYRKRALGTSSQHPTACRPPRDVRGPRGMTDDRLFTLGGGTQSRPHSIDVARGLRARREPDMPDLLDATRIV